MLPASRRGWAFSPWGFARRVFVGAYEDNILFLGSALTFDALLAALPLALLLLAALGYFVHQGGDAMQDILHLVDGLLPPSRSGAAGPLERAEDIIASVANSRTQLSVYGLPLFLWFSTRFFGSARIALNEVFDTHENRSLVRGKAVDVGLVFVTMVLVVVNASLTIIVADYPWLGRFVASLSTYGLGVALFFIVYTVAPTRSVPWDTALVAAAVASLGFEIAKSLYSLYLAQFARIDAPISNANAIALLLLVIWMYAVACVFLLGAEVAETYDLMRRQRVQRLILG